MTLKSEPIKTHLGEIVHVERSALLDEDVAMGCLALLEERGVLVFPRLGLTDAEQLAFTDRLGTRVKRTPGATGGNVADDDVYRVTLEAKFNMKPEYVLGTYFWHMDDMTSNHPPPKATLLTARRLSSKGGETEFANTYQAYENLPADLKSEIAGLHAVHSLSASLRGVFDYESREDREGRDRLAVVREHPLVWHQSSGRKSLVIGTTTDRIADMPLAEGRALLGRLLEWTVQPDFVYRHEWQVGDLVIWHNPGTLHRVLPYERNSGRMMHRTTLAGTEAVQ